MRRHEPFRLPRAEARPANQVRVRQDQFRSDEWQVRKRTQERRVVVRACPPRSASCQQDGEADHACGESLGCGVSRPAPAAASSQARPEPARSAAADVNASPANVAEPHPTAGPANSDGGMTEAKLTAARALAERMTAATAAPAPDTKAGSKDSADRPSQTLARGDTERTASADDADRLVAVLMVRPEIKSVSDLAGKTIAIDDRYAASNGSCQDRDRGGGGAGSPTERGADDGDQSAGRRRGAGRGFGPGISEAAERFPAIAGFKTFQIPLSPRALKERP